MFSSFAENISFSMISTFIHMVFFAEFSASGDFGLALIVFWVLRIACVFVCEHVIDCV